MPVSLQYLERCSADTGFAAETLERVTRLGELASAISRHPLLGSALALKGGTALNLCFGEAPKRLSVDLDYNFVGYAERERMQTARPEVEDALQKLASRMGFRVQQSANAFAARKLYAAYPSVLGPESRVELDVNYLWREPLAGVERRSLWQPGGLDHSRVSVVSLLELCVGKMLAFLDRGAPRDAWDVSRLPGIAGQVLESVALRGWLIAMSAMFPLPLPAYSRERIERKLRPTAFQRQLVPMLQAGELAEAKGLLDKAWQVVEPFLDLEPDERAYIDGIQNGVVRADLLFPRDAEAAARVARHPQTLWKIENVNKSM